MSHFDTTPSGEITNNLSNDLNVLDSMVGLITMDLLENGSILLIMVGSTMQLNIYIVAPGVLVIALNVFLSLYCYDIIISVQVLSMKIKSSLFNCLSEMMSGLIQITLFDRKSAFLRKFAQQLHSSLKARMNLIIANNFFSVFNNFATTTFMLVVLVLGVTALTPDNSMYYGVQIIFVFQMNAVVQIVMRSFMNFQSYMVNAERAHTMATLQYEAQL